MLGFLTIEQETELYQFVRCELSNKYQMQIDIEEAEMTAAKYGVMSIPNMVLFKNGEVADRIVGKTNKQNINKFVKN